MVNPGGGKELSRADGDGDWTGRDGEGGEEPATMLTVAVPETLPEVAVTRRPAATLVGAVNTPLLSIVPPLVVQLGVTGTGLL